MKQEIFAHIGQLMKREALLRTNTSALDIDAIVGVTRRSAMVAGAHFVAPANVVTLLEVVEGASTVPATLAAAMKVDRAIGKFIGYASNCDGFAADRSRVSFNIEQGLMTEEGVLPEEIDKVMAGAARRPAPARAVTRRATAPRMSTRDPSVTASPLLESIEPRRCGQAGEAPPPAPLLSNNASTAQRMMR
jgi:3-hydroxyacyl-CoA dehydrogenase